MYSVSPYTSLTLFLERSTQGVTGAYLSSLHYARSLISASSHVGRDFVRQ